MKVKIVDVFERKCLVVVQNVTTAYKNHTVVDAWPLVSFQHCYTICCLQDESVSCTQQHFYKLFNANLHGNITHC